MLLFFAVYPTELIQSKAAIFENFQAFFSAPLETYWRERPLQAATQLLRKVLLVIPLGILLASLSFKHGLKKNHRIMLIITSMIFLLGLELLQIMIVNKVAVASDVALNFLGLFLGHRLHVMHSSKKEVPVRQFEGLKRYKKYYLILVFLVIFTSLLFIHSDERTPYNIKELFNQDFVWLSSVMMSLSLIVAFALPPVLLDQLRALKKTSALHLLSLSIVHTLVVFNLFYVTFPNESLYDILGYPTWREQSHYLELGYRFLGFYLPVSATFFLVYSWLTPTKSIEFKTNRLAFSLLYAFFILPLSYIIVIVQAGTDNITELLPNNGHSFKLLYIIGYIFLLVYVSGWWVKNMHCPRRLNVITHAFLSLASAPLGYYFIQHGLQDVIIKYEKVFSGLQFILSPSRDNLLSGEQIFFRFLILHFMLLAMFFVSGFSSTTISIKRTEAQLTGGKATGQFAYKFSATAKKE
jgi:VanZ family protein